MVCQRQAEEFHRINMKVERKKNSASLLLLHARTDRRADKLTDKVMSRVALRLKLLYSKILHIPSYTTELLKKKFVRFFVINDFNRNIITYLKCIRKEWSFR